MLDTLSGVLIGLYLLSVAVKGNTTDLIAQAKKDKAFLQWGVAVAILVYLHGIPEFKGPVRTIIIIAFFGLFLSQSENIQKNVGLFWKQLGGN